MIITSELERVATEFAHRIVRQELKEVRDQLVAFDDAYDPEGLPAETVEHDQKTFIDTFERTINKQEALKSFNDLRDRLLNFAREQPEVSLPTKPSPPSNNVFDSPHLCKPWYHWIPIWDWDTIDYEETRRRADNEIRRRHEVWETQQKAYAEEMRKKYRELLRLD